LLVVTKFVIGNPVQLKVGVNVKPQAGVYSIGLIVLLVKSSYFAAS